MKIVSRAAEVAKRIFSAESLERIDLRLERTNIKLTAEEYVGIVLLTMPIISVGIGLIGTFFLHIIIAIALAIASSMIAFYVLTLGLPYYLAQRRAAELERALPDALRQVASTLRAGVGVEASLEEIVKSKYGALSREFERVVTEVRRGRTLDRALLALAYRSNSQLYRRVFHLIVEGIERGASLANVLDAVSKDAKEVRAIQRERISATTQQVLFLLAVALFAAPFIIGLVIAVGGIQVGSAGPTLPQELETIAMLYIMIQAFICSLAVGVIRYGRAVKGLSMSPLFVTMAALIFYISQFLV